MVELLLQYAADPNAIDEVSGKICHRLSETPLFTIICTFYFVVWKHFVTCSLQRRPCQYCTKSAVTRS